MVYEQEFKSVGKLSIGPNIKLLIDKDLCSYYYSLLPKEVCPQRVGRDPHITIVREWEIEECFKWAAPIRKLSNVTLGFTYEPGIKKMGRHFVVRCHSKQASILRLNLGLNWYRDGFESFHFTVGFLL